MTTDNGTVSHGELAEMRARNPKADWVEIPAAGHDLHLESLDAWYEALSTYAALGELGRREPSAREP